MPHDYVCIGCEQRVSEHETVIETAAQRAARGASIGQQYAPLADDPQLATEVRSVASSVSGST
jgi:hypothetical protein